MSELLEDVLDYEPVVLKFGTSGRRGRVVDLTQLEIYINALAELRYLASLPKEEGGIVAGEDFYFGMDLRPSSAAPVAAYEGRGGIAQAVVQAIRDAGLVPVNLGKVPTPAVMAFAVARHCGSMMVTGSHIPFDRNGYKTNRSIGELLKTDEGPVNEWVQRTRREILKTPASESLFDRSGMLKPGGAPMPEVCGEGASAYRERYLDFLPKGVLEGKRIVVYQHSAVGRDMLVDLLKSLGGEVVPKGRSETFVPIDTENIDQSILERIQGFVDEVEAETGPVDVVVSTDGDSDRPLILGVDRDRQGKGRVRFYGGDLVGMVVADWLQADGIVVPISCNDAIDSGELSKALEPKTRIGSPFVIQGMDAALSKGLTCVCGWEANGGFLTGSKIERAGATLPALPTRDAFLPILAVLAAAFERDVSISTLFERLPKRFSKAALLKEFPRPKSLAMIERLSPDRSVLELVFGDVTEVHWKPECHDGGNRHIDDEAALAIKAAIESTFSSERGFGEVARINYTDGVRIWFTNGDVAHIRPSGNADELRIYAVADSQDRADAIAAAGVEEPNGILRSFEKGL